jgi:hypothetical protein
MIVVGVPELILDDNGSPVVDHLCQEIDAILADGFLPLEYLDIETQDVFEVGRAFGLDLVCQPRGEVMGLMIPVSPDVLRFE